ncbi:MAG: tetratricopeptide repeat protein, partial [Planctomycetaceae bacterium]|nr:tetratricopeptide repeat protein [Planctomycetaceae bacterium]
MLPADDTVRALREALKVSPDNLPLRRHLAETLRGLGRFDEAEKEYREALRASPRDPALLLALGIVFHGAGKRDQALVVAEDLLSRDDASAGAHLLHARLLLDAGDPARAIRRYRQALDLDPAAA